ncbi:MAG: DNA-binding response regulator [Candidatus Kapaibacterium sp.]|nr:MAG: DNA-binding response regulator [Candidatus Kapabacteria bacterium]
MPIRILLVDDQPILTDGIRSLFAARSAEFEVVGQISHSKDVLQAAHHLKPDLILLDIDMPEKNGLEVLRDLKAHASSDWKATVIMLSLHADKRHITDAFHLGARGYMTKSRVGEADVLEAVRSVYQGKLYCCPQSKPVYDDISGALKYEQVVKNTELTSRQLDIAKLVAMGKTSKEIAAELNLSARTIENHRADILKKLRLRNTAELVNYANEQGW